jgi:hypothetical protein
MRVARDRKARTAHGLTHPTRRGARMVDVSANRAWRSPPPRCNMQPATLRRSGIAKGEVRWRAWPV